MATFNKIQRNNVEQEKSTLKISDDITRTDLSNYNDDVFLNSVSITFDNNKYVNAMFINQIKDRENSDFYLSNNIAYNKIEANIKANDITKEAIYYSVERCTDESYESDLNYFFLVVDETVPSGCDIIYYLITDDNRKFILKPNGTTPLILKSPCKKFKLSAKLSCNGINSPAINAYAVLYHDEYVENAYRLVNVDLSNDKNTSGDNPEIITLIRDNTKDDKLVEVLTSTNKIELLYDDEKDRLSDVEIYDIDTNDLVESNELIYEDYENSNQVIEEVLTKIKITKNDSI